MAYEEKIIWHEIETEPLDEDLYKVYGDLPDNGDVVLIATKYGDIEADTCINDGDIYSLECYGWKEVIAWAKHPTYKWSDKND